MRLINKFVILMGICAFAFCIIMSAFFIFHLNPFSDRINDSYNKITTLTMQQNVPRDTLQKKELEIRKMVEGEISFIINAMILLTVFCLTMFAGIFVFVYSHILVPLDSTVALSSGLAKGDYTASLKTARKDEIGVLVKSLNHLRIRMEHSISKLKFSHEREKKARLEAESTNNIKSDFLASISHELKNPLNSIIGLCSLILKDLRNDVRDQALETKIELILSSSETLNELISSLLELARLGKEDVRLDVQQINPSDFVKELIDTSLHIAERKSVSIENLYSARMPSQIETDKSLLTKTLQKLIDNAVRISPIGGSIELGCDRDEQSIVFWVKDRINVEDAPITLAEIYNQFLEGHSNLELNQGLQGVALLNLTIATANAELLNARIKGELDQNSNSVFKLILPLSLKDKDTTKSSDMKSTHMASNISQEIREEVKDWQSKNKREHDPDRQVNILMAEDSEANRLLVEMIIKRANYHLECVEDGINCVEVLSRTKFDLLLLDLQMPRMDGFDVLKKIRSNDDLNDMPVIVLTAYMEEGDHDKILAAGANDYLLKPIDVDELLEKIRTHI